jgi:hypothetical protein
MNFFEGKIPPVIYRKKNLIYLVVFTAVFALLFINLYEPFNSTDWYGLSDAEYFLYSSLLILAGVFVVVVSRVIMYFYTKSNTISYGKYGLWIICEILAMSLIYTFISYSLDENKVFIDVYKISIKNTSLIILLPYTIFTLIILWQEKNDQLENIREIRDSAVEQRNDIITFYDEKGIMKLSIKTDSLYYIESADNYVSIWYRDKQRVTKFLLRNTLKNIEEQFAGTNIMRCHRAYVVNFDQVKIAKKNTGGIVLDLGVDQIPELPVSKSYGDKVTKWFISSLH